MLHVLDCYIELLVGGIFSPLTVSAGLIGMVVGVLLTGTVGAFIALMGFYMIAITLFTIARTVYILLTAYIAFSFMVFISPLFIPCILFASTKDFFDGWLRLVITFLIQPIFLFAYLVMFLVAFNATVFHGNHSLYFAIAGNDSTLPNFKIGNWLSGTGGSQSAYTATLIDKGNVPVDLGGDFTKNILPTPISNETKVGDTVVDRPNIPFLFGMNTDPLHYFETGMMVNVIDWQTLAKKANPNGWTAVAGGTPAQQETFYKEYIVKIFLAFLMAAMVMYIFYSLMDYIPFVGAGAMGDIGLIPTLGAGNLSAPGSQRLVRNVG